MTVSDIQRWDFFGEVGINEPVRYLHLEAVKGRYVTYADHVAAVAAAREQAWNERWTTNTEAYDMGVKAARDAVEAENKNWISRVTTDYDIGYRDGTNDTIRLNLRAIDALQPRGKGSA